MHLISILNTLHALARTVTRVPSEVCVVSVNNKKKIPEKIEINKSKC